MKKLVNYFLDIISFFIALIGEVETKRFKRMMKDNVEQYDPFTGHEAEVIDEISQKNSGTVMYLGVPWKAILSKNEPETIISKGTIVNVIDAQGNTLVVKNRKF